MLSRGTARIQATAVAVWPTSSPAVALARDGREWRLQLQAGWNHTEVVRSVESLPAVEMSRLWDEIRHGRSGDNLRETIHAADF